MPRRIPGLGVVCDSFRFKYCFPMLGRFRDKPLALALALALARTDPSHRPAELARSAGPCRFTEGGIGIPVRGFSLLFPSRSSSGVVRPMFWQPQAESQVPGVTLQSLRASCRLYRATMRERDVCLPALSNTGNSGRLGAEVGAWRSDLSSRGDRRAWVRGSPLQTCLRRIFVCPVWCGRGGARLGRSGPSDRRPHARRADSSILSMRSQLSMAILAPGAKPQFSIHNSRSQFSIPYGQTPARARTSPWRDFF